MAPGRRDADESPDRRERLRPFAAGARWRDGQEASTVSRGGAPTAAGGRHQVYAPISGRTTPVLLLEAACVLPAPPLH